MYILPVDTKGLTSTDVSKQWEMYYSYLDVFLHRIPSSISSLIVSNDYYNPKSVFSPHDSWLESLIVEVKSSGNRSEFRTTDIKVKLLGAYHDRYLYFIYKNVFSYSQTVSQVNPGDWLYDEYQLSTNDKIIHEIAFDNGDLKIECEDIEFSQELLK